MLSVIIPTRNRARFLRNALESVQQQAADVAYEIIVVDNGSTDDTRQVVKALNASLNADDRRGIRYLYDDRPGLHIGRHHGAEEARGEILLYGDDDIVASPDWVAEIVRCHQDSRVGVVGGKVVPQWQAEPPPWVEAFRDYLSLLDLGDDIRRLHTANEICGCNLSIRRDVLFRVGGFNPDSMPPEFIKYRGDGETALMNKVLRSGYRLVYNGKAIVEHVIPPHRLTMDYFKRRAFRQGISDSFTDIRAAHGLDLGDRGRAVGFLDYASRGIRACKRYVRSWLFRKPSLANNQEYTEVRKELHNSHVQGWAFHRRVLSEDPLLLAYVLQANYLGTNGELPG